MSKITSREFIQTLGALVGVAVASQFDHQLGAMARALGGPQGWALRFDEDGLERFWTEHVIIGPSRIVGDSMVANVCIDDLANLWALATLTAPDGSQWTTTDGENWTCGDRRMAL